MTRKRTSLARTKKPPLSQKLVSLMRGCSFLQAIREVPQGQFRHWLYQTYFQLQSVQLQTHLKDFLFKRDAPFMQGYTGSIPPWFNHWRLLQLWSRLPGLLPALVAEPVFIHTVLLLKACRRQFYSVVEAYTHRKACEVMYSKVKLPVRRP